MRYRAFTQQLWSLLREKKIQTTDVSQRHQVHSKCKLLGMQEAKLGLKNQKRVNEAKMLDKNGGWGEREGKDFAAK